MSKEEDEPVGLWRTLRLGVPGVGGVEGSFNVLLDARLMLRFIVVKKPPFRLSFIELVGELPAGLELLASSDVSAERDSTELCRFHFLGSIFASIQQPTLTPQQQRDVDFPSFFNDPRRHAHNIKMPKGCMFSVP